MENTSIYNAKINYSQRKIMKTGFLTLLMVLAMTFTGCQAQTYKVVPSKNYVTQRVNLGNVSSLILIPLWISFINRPPVRRMRKFMRPII